MIIKLSFTSTELPPLCKGDILVSEEKGDTKGYIWSDIQCITIAKQRARGLKLSYNKEDGALVVENDWPYIEVVDHQISLFDYAKEKGIEL